MIETILDFEYLRNIFFILNWKADLPLCPFDQADPASVCTSEWRPWWQPSAKKAQNDQSDTAISNIYSNDM